MAYGIITAGIMVPFVLPLGVVEVREYLDRRERSPFAAWFDRLNREAAAKEGLQDQEER